MSAAFVLKNLKWQEIATAALLLTSLANFGLIAKAQTFQTTTFDVFVQAEEDSQEVKAIMSLSNKWDEAPLVVEFDANESIGKGLKYEWDFGDGMKANGKKAQHTFTEWGEHTVQLTVSNKNTSDSVQDTVYVTTYSDQERVVTIRDDDSDRPVDIVFSPYGQHVGSVGIASQFLETPIDVTISVSPMNATSYPSGKAYGKLYPAENVVPAGPLMTFEFPYDALTLNDETMQKLILVAPARYENLPLEANDPLGAEVRITRADGSEDFYLDEYIPGGIIIIFRENLEQAYGNTPPETVRISVQPVDYSGVLERR